MILLRQILQDEICCFPHSGSFRHPTWPVKEFLPFLRVHESRVVYGRVGIKHHVWITRKRQSKWPSKCSKHALLTRERCTFWSGQNARWKQWNWNILLIAEDHHFLSWVPTKMWLQIQDSVFFSAIFGVGFWILRSHPNFWNMTRYLIGIPELFADHPVSFGTIFL